MSRKTMWLPLIGLCVFGLASLGAWVDDEQEEDVTLEQVPAAVRATILKEAPPAGRSPRSNAKPIRTAR